MSGPRTRLFLERRSYRRRRMMEAARFLPFLGALLFLVPVLWPRSDDPAIATGEAAPVSMSGALIYIFGVWAVLICVGAAVGWMSRGWGDEVGPQDRSPRP